MNMYGHIGQSNSELLTQRRYHVLFTEVIELILINMYIYASLKLSRPFPRNWKYIFKLIKSFVFC